MNVEYRVLGPLEVLADGEPVAVPAGRCHVLLATLLLRPNQLVPVDELVDRVWEGEPPSADRAHKTLQMVVRRVRVALGGADCVRTRPGGYLAAVEPDQLDLLRFRALVGSGDFGAASALWRGSVLGNVPSERLHRFGVRSAMTHTPTRPPRGWPTWTGTRPIEPGACPEGVAGGSSRWKRCGPRRHWTAVTTPIEFLSLTSPADDYLVNRRSHIGHTASRMDKPERDS